MKFIQKRLLLLLLLLPFLLFMSTDEGGHDSGSGQFIGKVVNFVLLFGGLTFLLRKPMKKYLEERAAGISQTIKSTAERRSTAETDLHRALTRLEAMTEEVQRIKATAETEAKKDRERTLAETRREAEKIRQRAHQEIELLTQFGTRDLRSFAADLAIQRASENLQKTLTPKDHAKLIDKSIERLGSLYEKRKAH